MIGATYWQNEFYFCLKFGTNEIIHCGKLLTLNVCAFVATLR